MRKTSSALMALSLATLISAPALAASGDQGFATKAAQGGLAEVETGQLVQSKPGSQPVKQFAQTLVQDHSKANQELQQIAQQENVQLPSQPSEEQRMQMRKLQDLSGSALDRFVSKIPARPRQKITRNAALTTIRCSRLSHPSRLARSTKVVRNVSQLRHDPLLPE